MHERTDILVLGGGIAGLSFALRAAARFDVTLATKTGFMESNTWSAQGGIAAAIAPTDSLVAHVDDTMTTGGGLAKRQIVEKIVGHGDTLVQDLLQWGVPFTRDGAAFDLGIEGGHSHRRILHAGDLTGAAIGAALVERAKAHPRIRMLENRMAVDLKIGRAHV